MRFKQFLEERTSVRDFNDKVVEKETLIKLMDLAKQIDTSTMDESIQFTLYEDGTEVYEELRGVGGYAGVMIEAPHYIGVQLKNYNKETLVKAGYHMESLITTANQLSLGTCWISVKNVSVENKKILGATQSNKIDYITAIGYPKKKIPFEPLPTSSRLAIEDIVFIKEWNTKASIDELEKRGLGDIFYYARYAPSTKNAQPWRFIIKNNKIELAVKNPEVLSNYIDAGIIAYYFKGLAHDLGIDSSWNFKDNISKDANETYVIVGSFNI